jgi:hypothetical protein
MVNQAMLFTVKTVLRRLIDLLPMGIIPEVNPQSKEAILFDKALREIIHNAEVNQIDPENFVTFSETMRKIMLFLMEQDGYYRRYVSIFFDKIKCEWSSP